MCFIISFQIPLEIVFGNNKFLLNEYRLISNPGVVNEMVAYSSLMLNIFLIGASLSIYKTQKNNIVIKETSHISRFINVTPLFVLLIMSFAVFIFSINKEYIQGGHGIVSFEGVGNSFLGIFIRLSIVYLSMILYNNQRQLKAIKNTLSAFVSLFKKSYIVFLIIITIVFFLANNRVYVIYSVSPLIFAYFVFSKRKISVKIIFLSFFGILILSTLFKLYGIKDIFSQGVSISSGYIISESYSPFTAEVAGSVYSQSILFNEWANDNLKLYGLSYFVGVFRTIPGLMGVLNINPLTYDTARIATFISGASYGVGTTVIADLLINFGFYLSLLLFGFIGYLFSSTENKVYRTNVSVYSYVIYFTIASFILFIPRSSLNDFIGSLLFNLLFVKIYTTLFLIKKTEKI